MKLKHSLHLLVSLVFTGGIAFAQQVAPPQAPAPPIGPSESGEPEAFTLFIDGGGFLGVFVEEISKENMSRYSLREPRGVAITEVVKDSPAEKAGLKKDDVIVRFDDEAVTSVRKLNRLVSEVAPDHAVKLAISRSGTEQEVAVTIGKRSSNVNTLRALTRPPGSSGEDFRWEFPEPGRDNLVFAMGNGRRIGIGTTQLTKQLADYFGVAGGKGVLVTSVSEDSPAAKAGIKAGDVITAVDGEKIEAAGDLTRAINSKKEGDVQLTVIRDKSPRTIKVTPKEGSGLGRPGVIAPQIGRRIVIPRIELPSIPELNIVVPRIDLPATPEVDVVVPRRIRKGNVQALPRRMPI